MATVRTVTARPQARVPSTPFTGALARLVEWDARFRARRALASLTAERRDDLGLTLHDIAREAAKPAWRA